MQQGGFLIMRNRFDKQLGALHEALTHMGNLCQQAIALAARALTSGQSELTAQILLCDGEIDQMEREIEGQCMKLLLCQQPVARDLRVISSALKMISDMERIGDQAADIAEILRYIDGRDFAGVSRLGDMAREAGRMVDEAIGSFVGQDLAKCREVVAHDDVVDALFDQIKTELIALVASDRQPGLCLDLLMIAKYLERIGDHAVNIAQWVEYSITGEHVAQ